MITDLKCCYIDPEYKESCGFAAEWEVWFGRRPDDYTHSCSGHIGFLIPDDADTIIQIHRLKDER